MFISNNDELAGKKKPQIQTHLQLQKENKNLTPNNKKNQLKMG